MQVSNNLCTVTYKSCCCTPHKVDHLKKAVVRTDFMSQNCLCKVTDCSRDASHLREAAALHENYQHPQLHDSVSDVHTRDDASVSSGVRHIRCTCRAESQLFSGSVSAAYCAVCVCHRQLKPETLMHAVRCDRPVKDAPADHSYCQRCCTCIGNCSQDLPVSSCHHSVTLSNVTATACPGCTNFTQVNRLGHCDSWQTSRHSDLYSIQEEQEKTVDNPRNPRPGQPVNVIMDVNEWQRRHIEQLDRQKLEVCDTVSK